MERNPHLQVDHTMFPVRRQAVIQRRKDKDGPCDWRKFSYATQDKAAMQLRFADSYWDCGTREELIQKLREYSTSEEGLYRGKSLKRT